MHESLFARPSTENPACLRSTPRFATRLGGLVRREPIVPREVAAPATHHGRDCAPAPRGWPPAMLRRRSPGLRAAAGPDPPRCHPGRALYPAPAAAGATGQWGHHVPHAAASEPAAKKKSLHASERETPRVQHARAAYRQRLAALELRRLKFVDEAGVNLAMTRLYGRAPRGERVIGTIPQNYGENITLLGSLGVEGVHAVMTVNGATDAEVFRTYVKQVLGPTLAPGDIVVLDNLSAHKAVGVQQALARRGVRLRYLPPYSPDLSPMELCLSKLKTALRAAQARTRETLETAIRKALETVTVTDAWNWFKHCGYALK